MPFTTRLFSLSQFKFGAALLLTLVALGGCDNQATGPLAGEPTGVIVLSGEGQVAPAGEQVPSPVVARVVDSRGVGVSNIRVQLHLTDRPGDTPLAADVLVAEAVSDGRGEVSFTPNLGPASGTYTYRVQAVDVVGETELELYVSAGDPLRLEARAGEYQIQQAGQRLHGDFVVWAVDSHGNPSGQVSLDWTIENGQGSFDSAPTSTNATGEARARYRLDAGSTGIERIVVRSDELPGEVEFQVEVGSAHLEMTSPSEPPAAERGHRATSPVEVRVTNPQTGEPRSGVTVHWDAPEGGVEVRPEMSQTDALGRARTLVRMGQEIGEYSVRARVSNAQASMPVFTVGERGEVHSFTMPPAGHGDQQSAVVGQELANPFVVRVLDRDGHPVEGIAVRWHVMSGGGHFVATEMSQATTMTDEQGSALINFVLGTSFGTQQVRAVIDGFENNPVIFTSYATSKNEPSDILPFSRTTLKGIINREVGEDQMAVIVVDSVRSPVEGEVVSWAVVEGGAVIERATSVTDGSGVATNSMILRDRNSTVVARLARMPQIEIEFDVIGTGDPHSIRILSGNNQNATRRLSPGGGTGLAQEFHLPDLLIVEVQDDQGRTVKGAEVDWIEIAGGGSIESLLGETDFDGQMAVRRSVTEAGTATTRAHLLGTFKTVDFNAEIVGVGDPTVEGSGETALMPGSSGEVSFEVTNNSTVSRTFNISATSSNPNRVEVTSNHSSVTISAHQSTTITVRLSSPASATPGNATIRLRATDQADGALTHQGSIVVGVQDPAGG